jgi:catechol 2,3-dioxygenase-like lactoylglutathione lyase family enzyme
MTVRRLDHVVVVVEDLDAAIAFFTELGLEIEGRMPIQGAWVDRINAIDGLRVDIAMMRAPDGGKLELTRFHSPPRSAASPRPRTRSACAA